MSDKEKIIYLKNFYEVFNILSSKYETERLNVLSYHRVNGFNVISNKRNQTLEIIGEIHGLEKFLEEIGASTN